MACGLGMSISQVGLTGFFIGPGGKRLLPVGYFLVGLSLFLLMFVKDFVFIFTVVSILGLVMSLVTPSLASLTSKISESRVGERMGMLASVSSLGLAVGSFLGSGLYVIDIHLPYRSFALILLMTTFYLVKRFSTL